MNTDILLINPPYHKRNNSGTVYPLGLGYLSSSIKAAGFNVNILDCASVFSSLHEESLSAFKKWLLERIKQLKPKIAIGIGPCTTPAIKGIKTIADVCSENFQYIPLIYGGPLASIPGQKSLFFDILNAIAIVGGDGEVAICDILKALKNGQRLDTLNGVTTINSDHKINVIDNLDGLTFPERIFEIGSTNYNLSTRRSFYKNSFATMSISRGCPYHCSFCVSGSLRNNLYHRRSIPNVIDEIKFIVSKLKISSIVFYDDAFFPTPDRLEKDVIEFTQALKVNSIKIEWQIEMRPNVLLALNKTLIKSLCQSGCRQINVGFESAEPNNSRILNKSIAPDLIIKKCQEITSDVMEMRLSGTFIIGWPNELPESINDTIEYSKSLNLTFAHYYPLKLYPGTVLYDEIYKEKTPLFWYHKIMNDDLPWGELIFENGFFNRNELLKQVEKAYKSFYSREEWEKKIRQSFEKDYQSIIKQVSIWSTNRFNLTT